MTTFTAFAPSPSAPFQFTPTLDGQQYSVVIVWNMFGQRWYMNLSTLTGALVLSRSLVGSPPDYDINLVSGYFKSTLVYRAGTDQFEVSP